MLSLWLKLLRHRWFEYALGALVIALPVAVLTTHRSFSSVAESHVHDIAHRLGKNILVVPADTDLTAYYQQQFEGVSIPDTYPDRLRGSAAGQHIRSIEARLYANIEVAGRTLILVGDTETREDGTGAAPAEARLDPDAAAALGVQPGGQLRLGSHAFRVTGIEADATGSLGPAVFTSLRAAQEVVNRPGALSSMRLAGCWCRLDPSALAADVEKILPGTRAITVASVLNAQTGLLEVMRSYAKLVYVLSVVLISAIAALMVSSQVRRQSREIGLLLAIGARPWTVIAMFVLRGAAMGALGAAAGWLLGIPLRAYAATHWLGLSIPSSSDTLLSAIALGAGIAAISAWLPASGAASADPTVVLREG